MQRLIPLLSPKAKAKSNNSQLKVPSRKNHRPKLKNRLEARRRLNKHKKKRSKYLWGNRLKRRKSKYRIKILIMMRMKRAIK